MDDSLLALKTWCPCSLGLLVWRRPICGSEIRARCGQGPGGCPVALHPGWVVRAGCGEGKVCGPGLADEEASAEQK